MASKSDLNAFAAAQALDLEQKREVEEANLRAVSEKRGREEAPKEAVSSDAAPDAAGTGQEPARKGAGRPARTQKATGPTDRFTFNVDPDLGMKLRSYALAHHVKLTDVFKKMIEDLGE